MAKQKFTLTTDLINVEAEPSTDSQTESSNTSNKREQTQKKSAQVVRMSLDVRKDLKKEFNLWCLQKGFSMTEGLETALIRLINNN